MTTLSEVRTYLRERQRATVKDLAIGLSTTPDNARALLEMWRAKDKVRRIANPAESCGKGLLGGCNCAMAGETVEIYEWVDDKGSSAA